MLIILLVTPSFNFPVKIYIIIFMNLGIIWFFWWKNWCERIKFQPIDTVNLTLEEFYQQKYKKENELFAKGLIYFFTASNQMALLGCSKSKLLFFQLLVSLVATSLREPRRFMTISKVMVRPIKLSQPF